MLRLFGDSISIKAQQYVDNWDAGLLLYFFCMLACCNRSDYIRAICNIWYISSISDIIGRISLFTNGTMLFLQIASMEISKLQPYYWSILREHLLKKRMFSFGHCPNYLSPPLTPFRATCTSFFGRQNRRFARMTEKIPIIIMTVQW